MNWAKGRTTRGRGTSFKGALNYVLHDKGAKTSARVGQVQLLNLAARDPKHAWAEMMALCEAAGDLKRRSGVKATGQKLKKPVYAFTLNWHEADQPAATHMLATAEEALRTLGLENCQAVIVEHTDRPHKHVHIIVNLIDPDTGKTASLSNDEHKLDRWADDYEVSHCVIRSPDRRAKFHALDHGTKPPKRPPQPESREEWDATKISNDELARHGRLKMRARYAAQVQRLKQDQQAARQTRMSELNELWNAYRASKKKLLDRYQPFIDAVWGKRRTSAAHPLSEHARMNVHENEAWKELGRQQFGQRRRFDARERSTLGIIANIIKLHCASQSPIGLVGLFKMAVSGNERRRQLQSLHDTQKASLRLRQTVSRKKRSEALKAARRQELRDLSKQFDENMVAMKTRYVLELVAERKAWRKLAAERQTSWDRYRRDSMSVKPTLDSDLEPRTMRQQFNGANTRGLLDEKNSPASVSTGWRTRRSAATRRADGSYTPRDRATQIDRLQ